MDTERGKQALGEKKPRVEQLLLSREFLLKTFQDQALRENLCELADEMASNRREAGFIVQNIDGSPVVSEVAKASRWSESVDDEYLLKEIDLMPVIAKEWTPLARELGVGSSGFKENIAITIHSHPIEEGRQPEEFLSPSVVDLETWEERKFEFPSPNLIDGILVIEKPSEKALLLLYQDDPNQQLPPYYQQLDENASAAKILRTMQQSGIRYERLTFDLENRQFAKGELEKLDKFAIK
jgi:hypothetical protein